MHYELLRAADVNVTESRNKDNHPIAVAQIGDHYEHRFHAKSRVSRSLEIMSTDDLAERLTGGHYFFAEGQLVDFRDGHYNGFVHTDDSIAHLVEHLGIQTEYDDRARVHRNTVTNEITLGTKWSNNHIVIPGFNDGGEFSSELHFGWNPFIQTINSAFMLYRLICTNGMRGLSSFLNAKIPLVNRWEEHLEIANRQIQNKVCGMATRRIAAMADERATVAEVMAVAGHAETRADDYVANDAHMERLNNIAHIANPMKQLGAIYKDNVFADKRLAAQMPAHLSTFDVYNMATEISTHTREVEKSSNFALDRMANDLVFNRRDLTQHASRFTLPKQSEFSDPDAAFFGTLN